ncbi:MAG: hypothetical protein AAB339_07985 [Elusimicrobiota bacterium]
MRAETSAFLILLGLCGCAGLGGMLPKRQPPPLEESQFTPVGFKEALKAERLRPVRFTAQFLGEEDTILDLPDEYHEGFIRLRICPPGKAKAAVSNVVAPKSLGKALAGFKRGENAEFFAVRTWNEDTDLDEESRQAVLQVHKLARPGDPAQAALPAKPRTLSFRNNRNADDLITLDPDGSFRLRERGKEVSGSYERTGANLLFRLPNGKTANGSFDGAVLKDPDKKEWALVPEE